jgi:polyhydroxyalkanoate synthesis repressor PhaR
MPDSPAPEGADGARGPSTVASPTANIVRYPNRRFYDRTQGRYVTLQEIATMVRDGKTVTVRDSKTEKDLTGRILTQILLEFQPERAELLPVPMLHLMLRANDMVLGFLGEYLRQSLAYLEFWKRAAAFASVAAPLDWIKGVLHVGKETVEPQPPTTVASEADRALARRVEELERRLRELDAPSSKKVR